jgi:hypothetical protein
MNKKRATYKLSFFTYVSVSIIVFSVMIATFTFSYAYFGGTSLAVGDITLGGLEFQILNSLSNIDTEEENLIMPDEVITNAITILNTRDILGLDVEDLPSIFVRVKPILKLDNIYKNNFLFIQLSSPENWIQGGDDFIYSVVKLVPGASVQFNDYFVLSYLVDNSYQNAEVYLGVEVEVIQAEIQAYQDVWSTAPKPWRDIVDLL